MRIFQAVWLAGVVAGALTGCGVSDNLAATVGVVATVGTVPVIGRSPFDAVYSLATGRDCSVVRLDQGKSYCRPIDPPPESPAFCTRSLGTVNCWSDPATLPDHPMPVADGPSFLTPEQEAYRLRRWP
ncbi:hypothetical protein [Rhodopila sp.]|uniref:hypothetical protein n=1 Tax=Rhodopila sp. TaxID=2480087 RepID=UPI003D0DCB6F